MKKKPLILLNFKKNTGEKALSLAEKLAGTGPLLQELYELAVMVQPGDARRVSETTGLPVFIHDIGLKDTLHEVLDRKLLDGGRVRGVLINHPENRLSEDVLQKNILMAGRLDLKIIIGSVSLPEALRINNLYSPDYIAIENMELIGKDLSIRKKCPELVENAVSAIPNNLLFGAGVRTYQDIRFIIDCGGSGVLISSVVLGADDPLKALMGLLEYSATSV